jgi:hypothetical protein
MAAITNQNLNKQPANPSLPDVLNEWMRVVFLQFNCHAIGTIKVFNPSLQTATATINYTQTQMQMNPLTQQCHPH